MIKWSERREAQTCGSVQEKKYENTKDTGVNTMAAGKAVRGKTADNRNEKINRWIDKNRDLFGQKILCTGIRQETAVHLARMFSSASIVCLTSPGLQDDRRSGEPAYPAFSGGAPAAGTAAPGSSLRDPLRIPGDLHSYSGGLFDTVLAVDTGPLAPDSPGEAFPVWPRGTMYLRRASLVMEYYEGKAHDLCRHLRPGGTLLHLVCSDQDEYFLGYCLALAAEEMAVAPASIREIRCIEGGEKMVLQGLAARAGGRTEISDLIAQNLNHSLDSMNSSGSQYTGREAEIFLQSDAGELLRGYHLYQGSLFAGKLAAYTSVRNPNALYYYTDVEGDVPYLQRFHMQDRDAVLRHMSGELHRQKAADKSISWRPLTQHEDWSETE